MHRKNEHNDRYSGILAPLQEKVSYQNIILVIKILF